MNMTKRKKISEDLVTTPTPSIDTTDKPKLSDIEMKSFTEFVKKINLKTPKTEQGELEHLNNILKEFTSCYILMGYNVNKEAFVLSFADNQQDSNSLTELLRQVFFDIAEGKEEED